MPPYLLAFIWDACAPGSKLRKFAVDRCVIDVRVGRFGAIGKESMIKFAGENEDFQGHMWQLRLGMAIVSGETCLRTVGITLQS